MDPDFACEILCVSCDLAGDEDRSKRRQSIDTSLARREAGERTTGWGTLLKHLPRQIVIQAKAWLGVDDKPTIVLSQDRPRVVAQALDALALYGYEEPEKKIYRRGTSLVRVLRAQADSPEEDTFRREKGTPQIQEIPQSQLDLVLGASAYWVVWKEKNGETEVKPASPPEFLPRALLEKGEWPMLDPLTLFTETPVLLSDGTVLQRPGYDRRSGILYEPDTIYPTVPDRPTREDVNNALRTLWDPVFEFPFQETTDFAALVAACLTPLAELTYTSRAPLFLFDAPAQGSGKSFLAKICGVVATGRVPPSTSFTNDGEELRKRITTHAMKGDRVVIFDNVGESQFLGGDALASALTETRWSDRVLGANRDWSGPLTTTFYATANNCTISTDMARRMLSCTINSKHEKPELRDGFKHKEVIAYVERNHPKLVTAALTILRAYFAAGCPEMKHEPWGSYESWSRIVLGSIVYAGLPDPSPKRAEVSVGDIQTEYDRTFVVALRDFIVAEANRAQTKNQVPTRGATSSRIADAIKGGEPVMREALEALTQSRQPSAVQISGVLRRLSKKVFSGLYVANLGEDPTKKIRWWSVETGISNQLEAAE